MVDDQLTGAIGVFEIGEWVVLGAVYAALALPGAAEQGQGWFPSGSQWSKMC
jgi:hypothetical protein